MRRGVGSGYAVVSPKVLLEEVLDGRIEEDGGAELRPVRSVVRGALEKFSSLLLLGVRKRNAGGGCAQMESNSRER